MIRIIIVLLLWSTSAFADVKIYEHTYRNIEVGFTPIHEVLERFGKPIKITEYDDNIHYLFSGVKVTALKSTGKVSTIAIHKKSYVDSNGIGVGFDKVKLESKFRVKIKNNYFVDETDGIVYWLKDNRVQKIVLVRKLKVS
ncbi:MAG: hypothetical protein P8171_17700 [Candidatus Thiodiazotropha sp.]|jgi:hypothetical protein